MERFNLLIVNPKEEVANFIKHKKEIPVWNLLQIGNK